MMLARVYRPPLALWLQPHTRDPDEDKRKRLAGYKVASKCYFLTKFLLFYNYALCTVIYTVLSIVVINSLEM